MGEAEDIGDLILTFERAEAMLTCRDEFSERDAMHAIDIFSPYIAHERIRHLVERVQALYKDNTGREYAPPLLREVG